jgi:hypothetical protein
MNAVVRWAIVDDAMVFCISAGEWADADFDRWLGELEQAKQVTRMVAAATGNVSVSGLQRKRAAEVFKARRTAVTVVTDSKIVRGIATAMSWLGTNILGSTSWRESGEAARKLGYDDAACARLNAALETLRAQCG